MLETRDVDLDIKDLSKLPIIRGDAAQLKIAFENVVGNGIKYTPDNGRVTVSGRALSDAIVITIEDTGIGIPIEEQRRIFDQFHILGSIQNHSTSKSNFKGGGLGLGLPIAKGIIDAHQGRIWVESDKRDTDEPPGSIFHILLPIRQTD